MVFDKFSKMFVKLNPKRRVIGIGALHAVLLVYALLVVIFDIIQEQRPVTESEIFHMLLHVLLHVFLFTSLILGATHGKPIWLLPWLIVNFPMFVVMSYYILKYSRISYLSQFIVNITFIFVGWYLWFTVFLFFRQCRHPHSEDLKT